MDLGTLATVLQSSISTNPDERKAGEERLNEVGFVVVVCFFLPLFPIFVSLIWIKGVCLCLPSSPHPFLR
jgi:hypothetical protein